MVGRLVEQKDVGVRNEHRQKRQPRFLAAAEQGGRLVEVLPPKPKRSSIERVLALYSARAAEFLLQRGVAPASALCPSASRRSSSASRRSVSCRPEKESSAQSSTVRPPKSSSGFLGEQLRFLHRAQRSRCRGRVLGGR